ncbi:MAG: hypothetical protein WDN50_23940 [Bradyrhizobium sp.]
MHPAPRRLRVVVAAAEVTAVEAAATVSAVAAMVSAVVVAALAAAFVVFAAAVFGYGFYPGYYGGYYPYYEDETSCYVVRQRVMTRRGWRVRRVEVCE